MKITVYLGSSLGNDKIYTDEVEKLGKWIADNGHTLVFGGSKEGLMEKLAVAALQQGGKVIGVETQLLYGLYGAVEGITKLEIKERMADRIRRMTELGDMFIIFPGGVGTLEEAASVMSQNKLGIGRIKHIIFYNLGGFYNGIREYFLGMQSKGFGDDKSYKVTHFVNTITEIDEIVRNTMLNLSNKKIS